MKISVATLRGYRKLFGGKIPKGALEQIRREYAKNPGGPGAFERCVRAVAARGSAYSPRGVCATAGRKKYGAKKFAEMAQAGRRRKVHNPEDASAENYERFHGRAPEEIITVEETVHEHDYLAGIGKLHSLAILAVDGKHIVELNGFKGAMLCQNEEGTQLFIKGGDQSVNLGDFGLRANRHEQEVLGAATEVGYITRKDHLGSDGGAGERALHVHKFGTLKQVDGDDPRRKGGSRLPLVIYDVTNKRLAFAGGGYDLPEVGIRG